MARWRKLCEVMMCFSSGEPGAGQQDGRAGGVVQDGGHLARRPQAEDRDRHGIHVRQQHADARLGIGSTALRHCAASRSAPTSRRGDR